MSLAVRGSNPIWAVFDLTGKIFDGSYYMYVLENTLPYLPAEVYHYPDFSGLWTNPIQFLANGTLPTDIFFTPDKAYRLEFRKNNGIDAPSQSDPLMYEINDYIAPSSGGDGPIDSVAMASSNQITNPQFSLIYFASPLVITSGTTQTIAIAPGWSLNLAGNGNANISRVPLNNTSANPSNAPYALRLVLSGWDAVSLTQQFSGNGMLWANKIVSNAVTARVNGARQSIGALLIDSNSSVLAEVLEASVVNQAFNEVKGHGRLPATTNPNIPPNASITYSLSIPSNVDIYITSVQLVVQDLPIEPSFEQDSLQRQIDHTYHTAYPIVPVGSVIDYAGTGLPDHYLVCDGSSVSRTTYALLFSAIGTLWGSLDSSTFLLPNLVNHVTAGANGSLGPVGTRAGALNHAITIGEMPPHNHPGSSGTYQTGVAIGASLPTATTSLGTATHPVTVDVAFQGDGTPMPIVQPTAMVLKLIRYQ